VSLSEEDDVVACMPVYEACAAQELLNIAILCMYTSVDASLTGRNSLLVQVDTIGLVVLVLNQVHESILRNRSPYTKVAVRLLIILSYD